jgi:hypothetical protein
MLNHNDRPRTLLDGGAIIQIASYQTVYAEDRSMIAQFNMNVSTRIKCVSTIKTRR